MSEIEGDMNLLPTKHTYNIVMKAVAESEGALEAENLLLDLGDKYKEDHSPDLCPNSESFAMVIRAWLRKANEESNVNESISSLKRAVEWLSSLQEMENENNLSTSPELFLGVLRVARECALKRPDILQLATQTFNDYKESRYQIDHVTYSLMLQIGLEALSGPGDYDDRNSFVKEIFRDCCEDGFISNLFVQAISNSPVYDEGWTEEERQTLSKELFHSWPLPPSWARNLPNEKSKAKPEDMWRDPDSRWQDRRGEGSRRLKG